jgi:outer membrane biosynthesis protein TonB
MKLPFKSPFHTKVTHDTTVVPATSEPSISENAIAENLASKNLIPANSATEPAGVLALPPTKSTAKFSIRAVSGRAGGAIANLIIKNLFFMLILVSAGIHVAFLLLAPNPLKKTEKPRETEVTSTIPVVTLPPKTPKLNSSKTDLKLPFNPFALPTPNPVNAINTPSTSYTPPISFTPSPPDSFQYPLSSPLSVAPLTPDPSNALPVETKLVPTNPIDTKKSGAFVPEDHDYNDVNDQLIDNSKKPVTPQRNSNLKPGVAGNTVVNPSTSAQTNTSKNDKEGILGDLTVVNVLNKIGGTKIIFTEIAPNSANISAAAVEKGVEWIVPKASDVSGKQGTVEVALLVAPNGKVEERFFKSSGVAELDKIARETVTGYYDKFQPLKEEEHKGKYRYVRIKYKFPM